MYRNETEPGVVFSIVFQPEDMEVLHDMAAENVLSALAEGTDPCVTDTFLWERELRFISFPQPEVLHTIGKLLAYSDRTEKVIATHSLDEATRAKRLALGRAAGELAFAMDNRYAHKQAQATEAEAARLIAASPIDADEWLRLQG
jgi:hypothetical protein